MTANQAQWLTLTFILIAAAGVIWYDVWVAMTWGPEVTISRVLRRLFNQVPILYPVFWLLVGLLVGHIGLPAE
jgi:hypothetical protein